MSLKSKYIITTLIFIYLFSFTQFMAFDHDSCEEGHSHQKQCPLHKNCCGFSHLNGHKEAASVCEKFPPPVLIYGAHRPALFFFVEKLFDKTVFHPPRFQAA